MGKRGRSLALPRLLFDFIKSPIYISGSMLHKACNANIADIILQYMIFHRLDSYYITRYGKPERLFLTFPNNGNSDLCARLATQFLHSISDQYSHRGFSINLTYVVSRLYARAICRSIFYRTNYS